MAAAIDGFLQTANDLADLAGGIAREEWFGAHHVSFKPDNSALTGADTRIELRIREMIEKRYPEHGILGEEFGAKGSDREFTWVVDPIDGTRQFGARLLNFGVLIALCRNGKPMLGLLDQPLAGARFVAATGRGTRFNGQKIECSRTVDLHKAIIALANPNSMDNAPGSAFDSLRSAGRMTVFDGGCVAYGSLARGLIDICLNGPDLEPFDICALVPIIREAGGTISAWDGSDLTIVYSGPIVAASTDELHSAAIDLLQKVT